MRISSNHSLMSQGKRVQERTGSQVRLLGSAAAVTGFELLQNISCLMSHLDAISLTSEQICRNLANLSILTGPCFDCWLKDIVLIPTWMGKYVLRDPLLCTVTWGQVGPFPLRWGWDPPGCFLHHTNQTNWLLRSGMFPKASFPQCWLTESSLLGRGCCKGGAAPAALGYCGHAPLASQQPT